MKLKPTVIILLVTALCILGSTVVFAQHDNDLRFGIRDNKLAVVEPPNYEVPKIMFFLGPPHNLYIRDQGVDFFVEPGASNYQLKSVTWQQLSITPGLTVGSVFGSGRPGFANLTSTSPHIHYTVGVSEPGTYFLRTYLKNGISIQDQPVPDSEPWTMIWVAGSNYAAVDLPVLRHLPDTPAGSPENGFAGVDVSDLVVSSANSFSGGFYAQTTGRTGGIFIQSMEPVNNGDRIRVRGKLNTVGAERRITADSIEKTAGEPPRPLSLALKNLGGKSMGKYTPGTHGGVGVSNTGLLVKAAGVIRHSGGEVYLDDGSSLPPNGSGVNGIKISQNMLASPINLPANGTHVVVVGVSGAEMQMDGKVLPVIRLRGQGDITPL